LGHYLSATGSRKSKGHKSRWPCSLCSSCCPARGATRGTGHHEPHHHPPAKAGTKPPSSTLKIQVEEGEIGCDIICRLRAAGRAKATSPDGLVAFAPPAALRAVLRAALALGSRGALWAGHSTYCVQLRAQPLAQILPGKPLTLALCSRAHGSAPDTLPAGQRVGCRAVRSSP
jgi:hypothetical protein